VRHELGLVNVQLGSFGTAIARLRPEMPRLSQQLHEAETRARALAEKANGMASEWAVRGRCVRARSLRALTRAQEASEELDRKIRAQQEMAALFVESRTAEDKAAAAAAEEAKVTALKTQKKALIKAVKQLRAELEKATQVRDTYLTKLRKIAPDAAAAAAVAAAAAAAAATAAPSAAAGAEAGDGS
jgi:chromosome segregation ATPase